MIVGTSCLSSKINYQKAKHYTSHSMLILDDQDVSPLVCLLMLNFNFMLYYQKKFEFQHVKSMFSRIIKLTKQFQLCNFKIA
jgi:hypothetical protein